MSGIGIWSAAGCVLLVWCTETVVGAVFARVIPEPRALGMDFAFTAAFIAIARSLWRGRGDLIPWLTAVGVVAVSIRVAGIEPSWALVAGGLVGAAMAAVAPRA